MGKKRTTNYLQLWESKSISKYNWDHFTRDFSGLTLGGEAKRENSLVLMLKERGLILNLSSKTEQTA